MFWRITFFSFLIVAIAYWIEILVRHFTNSKRIYELSWNIRIFGSLVLFAKHLFRGLILGMCYPSSPEGECVVGCGVSKFATAVFVGSSL